jgi:ornithine cyclodeaminase/alanine dehydrogenase-like protein (mu-crystallin family)
VRSIEQAWVFDLNTDSATAYADEMSTRLSLPIAVAESPAEALRQADVVCTATTASSPVFDNADVHSGTHINAVGAYTPQMQEVPAETVLRAKVVIDHHESSMAEAGDLIVPINQGLIGEDHIYAELGEIASGSKPGRTSDDEVTLFKSVGVAVQDVAVAGRVLEAAERLRLGVETAL